MGDPFATRFAAWAAIACALSAGVLTSSTGACKDRGTVGVGGGGGQGGAGGAPGCPEQEGPLFTLHLISHDVTLPDDLEMQISWSAGDEPAVLLGDPSTYGTAEDNVVCIRKPGDGETAAGVGGGGMGGAGVASGYEATSGGDGGAAPVDELLCELWTSGPTRIQLSADGFVPLDDTLVPQTLDGCDRPVSSEVEIELVAEADERG